MSSEEAAGGFPISPLQARVWRLRGEGGGPYVVQAAIEIAGGVPAPALERAIRLVTERHEILRTSFSTPPGLASPLQVVGPAGPTLESGTVDVDGEDLLAAARRELDGEGTGVRWWLARGPGRRTLVITASAMCADPSSLRTLARELRDLCADPASILEPAEPLQYADYATWQADLARDRAGGEAGGRWSPEPAPVADGPFRPAVLDPDAGAACRVTVDALAERCGADPRAVVLAAWQALTWHSSELGDARVRAAVTVGVTADGRDHRDLRGAIGPYARRVPVTCTVAGGRRFADLARDAGRELAVALAHQDPPPLADAPADATPLGLAFEDGIGADAAGIRWSWSCTDRFALELRVRSRRDGLAIGLAYDASRFEAAAAIRLRARYLRLLEQVIACPQTRIGDLDLCDPAERHLVIERWNPAPAARAGDPTIVDLVMARAARTPDAPALVGADRPLSYRDLERRANQLAGLLRELGAGPGTRVALRLERSADAIAAVLATWRAGAASVPVDVQDPPARAGAIVGGARAELLVTHHGLGDVPGHAGRTVCLDCERARLESRPPMPPPGRAPAAAHVAYVVHTSGSTGRPNGVVVAHRSAASYASFLAEAYDLGPSDVVLQLAPFTFDAWLRDAVLPLIAGASVALVPAARAPDPVELLDAMQRHGVTRLLSAVPARLRDLTAAARSGGPRPRSLRTVLTSGEALRLADCEAIWEVFGPDVAIFNQYGPTECTMTTTFGRVTPPQRGRATALIGRPIPHARVYVLNEGLRPVPPEGEGELCIGGAGLAHGYLGDPALTAERFVPDPFGASPGARMYRTGDVGRHTADGELEFLGRRDDEVKVHGVRVAPAEIEAALVGHPEVREAAVVACPAGDGVRLVAAVVLEPGAAAPDLRGHLLARLPRALVPSACAIVEALPLTAHGKVDRRRLAAELGDRPETGPVEAPRSPVEEVVARVFAETLRLERVGVHSSFFELGGHSLLATRAVHRIGEELGAEVPLRAIFERPTPAGLAELIEASVAPEPPADPDEGRIARLEEDRAGGWPLSFAQQRIWLLNELDPGNSSYNVRLAVRVAGDLDAAWLREALTEVVRRHAVLRTTIASTAEGPVQVVHQAVGVELSLADLRALPAGEREAEARRRLRAEAATRFDLARGPLFRTAVLRVADAEHVLALTMHHVVADEWSVGVLFRELIELTDAARSGRSARLPELAVRYVDFAAWQRRRLSGPRLDRLADHWTERLRGATFELALPFDRPRPAVPTSAGERLTAGLATPLVEALDRLARAERGTLFMGLLAAFTVLLRDVTGQDDLVVGSPIAARSRPEVEPLIGFFANILLLRVSVAGDPTFRELLGRVRGVTVDAYAHQDMPFEKLVEILRPERVANRTPLVPVWFVLHNAPLPALELPGLEMTLLPAESETAKFDLNFALTEDRDALSLAVEYPTDLFERSTALGLLRRYETVLADVAEHPDDRLSTIRERVAERERRKRQMTNEGRDRSLAQRLSTLRATRPEPVRVSGSSMVRSRPLRDGETLPLLVEPAAPGVDLERWAADSRAWIAERLDRHGAILFRGFDVEGVEPFERVTRAYSADLLDYHERSTPRQHVGGKVYTSTDYPPDRRIPLHCESAYSYYWPMKLWFHCVVPADEGGATPLSDSRRLMALLDPAVVRRFTERRVMYVRNYHDGFDIPWQVAFQTEDREVVADYCRQAGMEFEWRENGVLRTRQVLDAVVTHPGTGDRVWFNQVHASHVSTLDADVRLGLLELFGADDLPRDVRYGDGAPIGDAELAAIAGAYAETTVAFPWQRRDVLLMDNMLVAHGREPFRGRRRVVVAMSEPWDRRRLAEATGR